MCDAVLAQTTRSLGQRRCASPSLVNCPAALGAAAVCCPEGFAGCEVPDEGAWLGDFAGACAVLCDGLCAPPAAAPLRQSLRKLLRASPLSFCALASALQLFLRSCCVCVEVCAGSGEGATAAKAKAVHSSRNERGFIVMPR